MKQYTASYRHNEKSWSFEYFANDLEDAKRKLQSIKSNAELDGELVVSVGLPFIERIRQWLK